MKATKSEFVSRAGVYFSGYVLSMSGIIFRETSSTDIGVDGQIELVDDDGEATGMLACVQIKSGDSFSDSTTKEFTFKSTKEHYKYWAKLSIPTIGIVYSPKLKTASWFAIDYHSKQVVKNSLSCQITQKLEPFNEISIENLPLSYLSHYIIERHHNPLSKVESDNILDSYEDDADIENNSDKLMIWKRMTSAFFSSNSSPEVIYDVGYRLSWYFPTVSDEEKDFFYKRLSKITVTELYNVFKGIHFAYEHNCEKGLELITDLLRYNNKIQYLFFMLKNSDLPKQNEMHLIEDVIKYFDNFD